MARICFLARLESGEYKIEYWDCVEFWDYGRNMPAGDDGGRGQGIKNAYSVDMKTFSVAVLLELPSPSTVVGYATS